MYHPLKKLILFLIIVLLMFACRQKQQSLYDQFSGRWVASYFLDSLSLSHITTIPFGATEISIPSICDKDSITFWNEDVEGNWKYPMAWLGDTLVVVYDSKLHDHILLMKDGQLMSTFRDVTIRYHKVDNGLVNKADDLDITVVRLLVNRVMSRQTFTDEETKKTVRFEENGLVSGLKNFVRYYIAIAGDDANIDNCISITFFDANGNRAKWGMRGNAEMVEFYALHLLTEPDEKPWYEADSLACRLLVNDR